MRSGHTPTGEPWDLAPWALSTTLHCAKGNPCEIELRDEGGGALLMPQTTAHGTDLDTQTGSRALDRVTFRIFQANIS